MIKTALSLHHQQLPPSLHFERANPALGLATGAGYVYTWDSNADVPGNEAVTLRITVDDGVMGTSTWSGGCTSWCGCTRVGGTG